MGPDASFGILGVVLRRIDFTGISISGKTYIPSFSQNPLIVQIFKTTLRRIEDLRCLETSLSLMLSFVARVVLSRVLLNGLRPDELKNNKKNIFKGEIWVTI